MTDEPFARRMNQPPPPPPAAPVERDEVEIAMIEAVEAAKAAQEQS